jgi:hypothetical protein
MRRELTTRCVSTGTIRADSPDGARCELRDVWLELDGAPAHVQIMETCDSGRRTRECTVEFDRIVVRSRTGHDVTPLTCASRMPLDWLLTIAEWMRRGERRTVSLWVRSMDPAALLNAAPVMGGDHAPIMPWATPQGAERCQAMVERRERHLFRRIPLLLGFPVQEDPSLAATEVQGWPGYVWGKDVQKECGHAGT